MSANAVLLEHELSPAVIIATASRIDCELLAQPILRHNQFRLVGSAISSKEAIFKIGKLHPDIALISARLQDGAFAGIILLRELRAFHLRTRVIILVDENQPDLIVEAFRNGARGVFCRTGDISQLRKCIQKVYAGEIWANSGQLEHMVEALAQVPATRLAKVAVGTPLSKREEEIARLVASGLSNREVAQRLGLSQHTVKNNLFRTFEKLEISTRLELVLYILSQSKGPQTEQNQTPKRESLVCWPS
jgi:DNA-binding NarL/FixJ family response regulator